MHPAHTARAANSCGVRPAPDRRRVATTLALATFSLLCAGCTKTPANCRGEVAAAFERLNTSHRPYRTETIIVSAQQTLHVTAEFVPPDRTRQITNYGAPRYDTVELIRVGRRVWYNQNKEGWREDEHGLAEVMDFVSALPNRAVPPNAAFECLGRVEFKGTTYIGYRARIDQAISRTITSIELHTDSPSKKDRQDVLSKLEQMPQEWRTVFVDIQNALPAHDLVAAENQPDNPRSSVKYTYPVDIRIEPPVQ